MRVLLVSTNTERINMPVMPVGLAHVTAATRRAGHEVSLVDLMGEADPLGAVQRAISALRPEVIGLSIRNIDDQSMESPRFLLDQVPPVVAECRARSSARIVLGGAGYSMFPDEALAYLGADAGVQGDGEEAFPALLDRIQKGEDVSGLPGVHVAGRGAALAPSFAEELDDLPLPDEDLWTSGGPIPPDLWVPIQTRRGCPNDCCYCATFRIQGRAIRSRSPHLVMERIGCMVQAGFRQLFFVDNSFNIPESQALEICRQMSAFGRDVRWRCILYAQGVSEELVSAMAGAGCVEVSLGFESGCRDVLREMNKRFTPEEVRRASDLLERAGIRRTGFLLLGAPGETKESVEESLAFAESLRLDALRTTVGIRLYPGTPLARRAVEEGVIRPDEDLLFPRFYMAPGMDPWLRGRVTPGFRTLR
jgi:radical SAM superfamily enzyme YgiQ (UPF0313 family)